MDNKNQQHFTIPDVSIIIPIYNGSKWIEPCFESIFAQTFVEHKKMEICICNDSSTDNTLELLNRYKSIFEDKNIKVQIYVNTTGSPKGVGYAKNKAVSVSTGSYLCFQDIDDIMLETRILEQYNTAITLPDNYLIGSLFRRQPENSTARYTQWANDLTQEQLNLQIYTSNGPTIIMPTWFCHRTLFERVGGFSEDGQGIPEDLIFFYKHLDLGGKIARVNKCLLIYHYHQEATSFSIHKDTIWQLRIKRLEDVVLPKWEKFTIWNAGKQGRRFYHSLTTENKDKVIALCDVDVNKIRKKYVPFDPKERKAGEELEIVHFKDARPPFVICVKLNMTDGNFENNLQSLNLVEGQDYIYFS